MKEVVNREKSFQKQYGDESGDNWNVLVDLTDELNNDIIFVYDGILAEEVIAEALKKSA